jgi:hypothetical protein
MENMGACAEHHHAMMAERAKEKGCTMPSKPKRDACAGMKKSGDGVWRHIYAQNMPSAQ